MISSALPSTSLFPPCAPPCIPRTIFAKFNYTPPGSLDILRTGQYCHLHSMLRSVGAVFLGPPIPGLDLPRSGLSFPLRICRHPSFPSGASRETPPPRFSSDSRCCISTFPAVLPNHLRRRVATHRSGRPQTDQRAQSPRRPRHLPLTPGRPER